MDAGSMEFRAFEVSEICVNDSLQYSGRVLMRTLRPLLAGEVLVRVEWSSLNYKDALSAHGNKGVTRAYPHVPGIDAVGTVVTSEHEDFTPGAKVVVTGYDLGMNTSGGFAQFIQVPAQWLVPLPAGLTARESMIYGTAGLTSALCVEKLLNNGLRPDQGMVLVTGATGGVGSIAVALLSQLGFEVAACTGKPAMSEYLCSLGASAVLARSELAESSPRPLLKERWAAAIDVSGGELLWNILRSLRYGGSVASCGLVGSPIFGATVYPFILRNVNLLGVDSVNVSHELRCSLWQKLAGEWRIPQLNRISKTIDFNQLHGELKVMMLGDSVGRTVLDVNA